MVGGSTEAAWSQGPVGLFDKAMEAFELTVGRDERELVSPEAHKMVLLPRVVCRKLENKGKIYRFCVLHMDETTLS